VTVDVLAIGAHPDDAELGIGGLLCKLSRFGCTVGLLDLTRGEMSTRGTVDERAGEAREAARILGVARRECADLPDGAVLNTDEQRRKVIPFIRDFRPKVIIIPGEADRHPDHRMAHNLSRDANYLAGLRQLDTGQEPYRATFLYHYHPYFEDSVAPDFIIDISEDLEAKIEALKAHRSQFYNPEYDGEETFISSQGFWDSIHTRAAYWGNRVHVAYGEPLSAEGPLSLVLPPGLGVTR